MTKLHLNTRQRNELAKAFLVAIEYLGHPVSRAMRATHPDLYDKHQSLYLCGALGFAQRAGRINRPTEKRAVDLLHERMGWCVNVETWLQRRGYAYDATPGQLLDYRKRWAQALHDEFITTGKG